MQQVRFSEDYTETSNRVEAITAETSNFPLTFFISMSIQTREMSLVDRSHKLLSLETVWVYLTLC